jgi:GT2 family glycosyltransferase
MKRPTARALKLSILPGGLIEGIFSGGTRRAAADRVAIVLDDTIHAVLAVEPGPKGTSRFSIRLPTQLLFKTVDVLALPDGESLLGMPIDLGPTYALKLGAVGIDGPFITGSFSAAPFLAQELGVEFMAGTVIAARATARRDDGGVPPVWQFRIPIHMLLLPHQKVTLCPRIAGLLLTGPQVTATPSSIGYMGCLDSATLDQVSGWVIDLSDPERRVQVDILVNAEFVARLTADLPRPDIKELGYGQSECGFTSGLPQHPDKTGQRRIAVRLTGLRTELSGSPVIVDLVPNLMGKFDTLHGMSAHGWAINRAQPDVPILLEVIGPGGEVLGTGPASFFRGDLLDAGLNGGLCAFKIDISAHFERMLDQNLYVRIAGTSDILSGSPQRATTNRNMLRFLHRRQNLAPGTLPRLRRALNHRAGDSGITFIMPVHDTPRAWLIEALESVRAQFCDRWELICVDDGSRAPHVAEILSGYAAREPRVRVLRSPQNVGIARAINFGLRAAKYPYVAFMDHDDKLEPDAAWQLINAARLTDADLLYSDEAQTAENIDAITEFRLRPAFSHDYYLSHPYFVHVVCARTDIARRIGGWDESMAISADVDFVLRMIEAAKKIGHIPAVLYRWRTHGSSTGHAKQDIVMAATTSAIQRHLDRLHTGAVASPGVWFNQFRVDWPATDGRVLIVIPTRNKVELLRTAVESIERTTPKSQYKLVVIDHQSDDDATIAYLEKIAVRHTVMPYRGPFNFSAMNNAAVMKHGGDAEFVLFLNNDVEATQDGWLDRMRRLAARADVGAVGALLMYVDRSVQHAGVILGFNDSADHALKFQNVFLDDQGRRNLGYNCALSSVRDYSAVTAACLMTRRDVFDQIGGFDEDFAIGFNDTDLCLRIKAAGYRILYDGATILYHYESATRSQTKQVFHPEDTTRMIERWGTALREGDAFYNPNLSLTTQDHVAREDAGCRVMNAPRVTVLELGRWAGRQ